MAFLLAGTPSEQNGGTFLNGVGCWKERKGKTAKSITDYLDSEGDNYTEQGVFITENREETSGLEEK